jgi:predicted nuclease of predicted toxin-antitoxin system
MIRLLVDESFNNDIVRGVLRRLPDLDIVRAQDEGLSGMDDAAVLAYAASEGRIVLTHDVRTLTAAAWDRVRAGQPMPGVFAVAQDVATAVVVEELVVISECSDDTEWRDQVRYLPLR